MTLINIDLKTLITVTEATTTNTTAYALDYVFQLKVTNTDTEAKDLYIKELKLTSPTSNNAYKAFRVATFIETSSTNAAVAEGTTDGFTANTGDVKAIYALSGDTYQTFSLTISFYIPASGITYISSASLYVVSVKHIMPEVEITYIVSSTALNDFISLSL